MNTIISLMAVFMIGCASAPVKLHPAYPPMNDIHINDDGTMNKKNVDKTVENVLNLQRLIDIIW